MKTGLLFVALILIGMVFGIPLGIMIQKSRQDENNKN